MSATLRFARADDGPALAAVYAPAVVERATSFEVDAPDGDEMARRVAAIQPRTPWLVCEHRGGVVGYAYASPHRDRAAYQWSVDVSAYVHADAHRAGVARGLYAALFEILVRQGFRNAYAGMTLPNAGSEGMHRAAGFSPVGVYRRVGYKLGAWHDVLWMERRLAPHEAPVTAPMPLDALRADATGAALVDEALLRGAALVRLG